VLPRSERKEKGRRKASRKIKRVTKSKNIPEWLFVYYGLRTGEDKMGEKNGEGFQGHF
jgi:hypothetical protein